MTQCILFVLTSHDRKRAADAANAAPSGFYLSEIAHPHAVLTAAGYAVDFVSPRGGRTRVDGLDLDDPVNAAFWNDAALRAATETTLAPSKIDPDANAAIFYAGGHATMWDFPGNTELAAIAARIYECSGVVAAVCHGPTGLVNVKLSDGCYLVEGKEVSAFTNDEERAVGLADTVLAYAGSFSLYTYISPLLLQVTKTSESTASLLMLGYGVMAAIGNVWVDG